MITLALFLLAASEPPPRTFVATAYCLKGRTATGSRPGPGTVAVDPRVIPLGSRVHVAGYGWGVARDTGRAIRGRRLDLWLSRKRACRAWGRRAVTVRVLPPARKAVPRRRGTRKQHGR